MSRTPLAWKNLTSDWRRLFLGAAGVGFAAVLMFMQNGFRNALLDSPVQILKAVDCDLVATSRARFSLTSEHRFSYDLLNQVAADPDVISAIPIYIERARAQIRVVGNKRRPIRVVGIPLDLNRFSLPEIHDQLSALEPPRSALLDRRTRSQYGFAVDDLDKLASQSVELLNNDIRMVGTFGLGTDFANDGTVLLSQDNFAHYFPFRGSGDPLSVVDLGLIHLNPDADPVMVAKRLQSLAPDVWVVTPREDLVQREIQFWNTQTPIGMIFFIGSMMGFAVGVIICYQILFTSIHDAMPEFATLKAMGYPNRYFLGLVVRQSLYLSLIGFLPALLVSWGLFQVLQTTVGLPMLMDPWRIGSVLGLTVLMCLVSGILALRKLITADPASLF
ncbi:FtsX-like permease family protein [Roseimaritima multifibrata]|uniref:FtsX-like permease family protein n=1 Tax=Roseimaritima multifibrata TaxID=1930274 RepID=A0A517MDC9_9BACT|nr:ABC transporter permease DevC [Roseimaritima multifibrata]QDS92888.1 FtsX-like permease family protein [Roseimaritima multifibrata]